MVNELQTKHKLDFLAAPWELGEMLDADNFKRFKVGTCHGLWQSTEESYDILVVDNEVPGNGHLEDVFEWFEHSCKRDKKVLKVLECMNDRFLTHLIEKRGFKLIEGTLNIQKHL